MKKVILVLLCGAVTLMACNSSGSSSSKTSDSSSTTPPPTPEASAPSEKGLELIGASDCTTCHRLHKTSQGASIGPAYSDVAARFAPAADSTVERLVQKIIKGGSGDWGTVPMTPHPALATNDVKTMVTYILSIKN